MSKSNSVLSALIHDQIAKERKAVDKLLLPAEVSARIRLSLKTIYRLRRMNQFPAPMVVGQRRLAWRESDIELWLASRATASLAALQELA